MAQNRISDIEVVNGEEEVANSVEQPITLGENMDHNTKNVDEGMIPTAKEKLENVEGFEKGDGFWDHRRWRILFIGGTLFWYIILSIGYWFDTSIGSARDSTFAAIGKTTHFKQGSQVTAAGEFFTIIGLGLTILVQIFQKLDNFVINLILSVLIVGGGAFYFFGGCTLAGSENATGSGKTGTAQAGVDFGLALYFLFLTMVLSLDMIKNLSNSQKRRQIQHILIVFFVSLILFFSYATLPSGGSRGWHLCAAGWFFCLGRFNFLFFFGLLFAKPSYL